MAEVQIPLDNGDIVTLDEDRRNVMFNIEDIYKYRLVDVNDDIIEGNGRFIPNVDDIVYDYNVGMLRVTRVDLTSYVAELRIWELPKTASEVGVEDVLLGVGPGYSSETWRCLIDRRVFPYRLQIDGKLRIYGSASKEIRVFKGVDITSAGEVISAYYSQSGDYVSDAIPLELVGTQEFNNLSIKAPLLGATSKQLNNGEIVTAVVYGNAGQVMSISKLLVHNTNIVRRPEDGMKRVQNIELISPFLSESEPDILEVPINVTVATLAMRAKVTYIDGTSSVMDVVDEEANGKFKLLGLKYWSPTISGTMQGLTLAYHLSDSEEYSYLQGETANGDVTKSYRIRALVADPAYSLKLYAFPYWVSSVQGYALEFWLYDLDREVSRRVPKAAVELGSDSAPFDGLEYTQVQHLKVGVDLAAMDPTYGSHRHVQNIQISLLRDGTIRASNWRVKFASSQPNWFGDGLEAAVSTGTAGLNIVRLANGETSKETWLQRLFYNIDPLYDPQTEVKAPEPTHFILVTKTRTFEVAISQWSSDITFINDLANGEAMFIRWIKRTASTDLQLGVSALPVHIA